MSENRSRYSTAPLHDLKHQPPRQPPVRTVGKPGQSPLTHQRLLILLQVMLVAVLPLLFIIALLAKDTRLHWGFVITSAVCLAGMFLARAFVPNARQVLGVVHSAMIAVALFAILVTSPPVNESAVQPVQDLASIFSENSSASMVDMNQAQAEKQGAGKASAGSASLAQQKLEQFMLAWANKDYAAMVSYSAPNWVNRFQTQREAETAIFHLSAIRTPLSYVLLDVSGSDSDQTRTITMQASISRNDNREPATYNFQILMIRSNNEWFVDPNSISSSQIVQPQASQPPLQTGAIAFPQGSAPLTGQSSQAVRSDTMLYYNQDGGEYYHADANCSSVGTKYKPLKAMFYYRDVSSEQFKNLKPCPVCGAPSR